MKIERTNKAFQPIELKITIETKEELHDLYARTNTGYRNYRKRIILLNENLADSKFKASEGEGSYKIYNVLNDILDVD